MPETIQDTTQSEKPEYEDLIGKWKKEYLEGKKPFADSTVRNSVKCVRVFFEWYKTEIKGIPEEEFIFYKYPSTHMCDREPNYSPQELLEMNKREFEDVMRAERYEQVDAKATKEILEQHPDSHNVKIRYMVRKMRMHKVKDHVEVTSDDVMDIDVNTIFRFVLHLRDEREVCEDTIWGYYSGIKHFFNYLAPSEFVGHLGLREPPKMDQLKDKMKEDVSFKSGNEGGEVLGFKEAKKLVNRQNNPKRRALVLLMLKTGLRVSAVSKLDVGDLHLDEKYIRVEGRKNDRNTDVIIDDETVRILKFYLKSKRNTGDDDPLFGYGVDCDRYQPRSISNLVKKSAAEAGIRTYENKSGKTSKVSGHWLRHTFSNFYVYEEGGTEAGRELDLKIQLGHKLNYSQEYQSSNFDKKRSMEQRRRDYKRAVPNFLA